MNHLKTIFMAVAVCTLAGLASAQDTNVIRTRIGLFETRPDVVLIKGVGQVGSLPLGSAQVTVRSKETADTVTGEKAYGLAFDIDVGQSSRDWILVDDDEVDALLNGVSYLSKINYDVTTLPGFEATFTTKAGLRVIADSVRKDGGVRTSLQFGDTPRIPVSGVQMTQLYNLILQGRKTLDALKAGK